MTRQRLLTWSRMARFVCTIPRLPYALRSLPLSDIPLLLCALCALLVCTQVYCILNALKDYDPSSFPYADEASLRTQYQHSISSAALASPTHPPSLPPAAHTGTALTAFYETDTYLQLVLNYTGYSYQTGFAVDDTAGIKVYALHKKSSRTTHPLTT